MSKPIPLYPGKFYHVYNRGNNRENIFLEEKNYAYFLNLYAQYIFPIAITYAYCLLRNHFHFLIRVREEWQPVDAEERHSFQGMAFLEPVTTKLVSRQFANLFGTYTKAINRGYNRSGSLFTKPFRRKLVETESYFYRLVPYINQNAQHHGFVDDFRDWKLLIPSFAV